MNKGTEAVLAEIKRAAHHAKTVDDWGEDENNFHDVMTPDVALQLIAALEQSQQYAKQRDEENQDLMLTIGRFRVEREQLEASKLSVKLPDLANDEFWLRFDGRLIFREETYRSAVYRAIEAAGGSVEGSD